MLQITSSPHSKEQAALATQTTSTEKESIARHTVPDCRGRTTDRKSTGWREKKRTFGQINAGKQNLLIVLPVFQQGETH